MKILIITGCYLIVFLIIMYVIFKERKPQKSKTVVMPDGEIKKPLTKEDLSRLCGKGRYRNTISWYRKSKRNNQFKK